MHNLGLRLLSAAILIPLSLLIIFCSSFFVFSLVTAFLAALSVFEYTSIVQNISFLKFRLFSVCLSFLLAFSVSYFSRVFWLPALVIVLFFPAFFLVFVFFQNNIEKLFNICVYSQFGVLYTGLCWGFISLIFVHFEQGRYWVFSLFLGSILTDTFAYLTGRLWGRKKLAPSISPGKTWIGFFGGFLGMFLALFAVQKLSFVSLDCWQYLLLGLILSVATQLGDLMESFIKRACQVKDSGKLIPGHGGILDRCDSLMLGAPILFLYLVTFNYH